ncbi:3-methyl-2-oxobutanoate dehydrogenase subunit VorB, partial [bacterium]|nr:3-methyl-2-oxobutanoate dehydrogenase subunit VorB [bacterium]
MVKRLMKGNEAIGEGAISAGCRFYAGYPITPQNELIAYMAENMPRAGGVFIQSESELAAISMLYGASLAGARAMTSSSSPGISLMQEGISYIAGAELPCVIVNIQRGGPGLGNISGAQGDYFQATRGGGHGDYRTLVLAPHSVQEMFHLAKEAFDLADRYRNPVIILGDGVLGQMMEPMIQTPNPKSPIPKKDWILDGCQERAPRSIKSLRLGEGVLEKHNEKLAKKYQEMEKEIRYEAIGVEDAQVILVAFGTPARICKEAIRQARKEGLKVGLIRPITLFPFPKEIILENASRIKGYLTV